MPKRRAECRALRRGGQRGKLRQIWHGMRKRVPGWRERWHRHPEAAGQRSPL